MCMCVSAHHIRTELLKDYETRPPLSTSPRRLWSFGFLLLIFPSVETRPPVVRHSLVRLPRARDNRIGRARGEPPIRTVSPATHYKYAHTRIHVYKSVRRLTRQYDNNDTSEKMCEQRCRMVGGGELEPSFKFILVCARVKNSVTMLFMYVYISVSTKVKVRK